MSSHSAGPSDIPAGSLLATYAEAPEAGTVPNYSDCYSLRIGASVSLPDFLYAFYTSPAFSIERKLLALALRVPSSDEDAKALATDRSSHFSAWRVENRRDNEILLRFPRSGTGSWLMARPCPGDDSDSTELLFGSVVFPKTPDTPFGPVFHALTGFHRFYSRILLNSARKRLLSSHIQLNGKG